MPAMSFTVMCESSYGLPVFPAYIGEPAPNLLINENAERLMKTTPVMCCFDTGANITTISASLANKIQLPQHHCDTRIVSPNANKISKQYWASICLPNNFVIAKIPVGVVDFGLNPIELNIGMNIIELGDFSLTHKDGNTFLSFSVPM